MLLNCLLKAIIIRQQLRPVQRYAGNGCLYDVYYEVKCVAVIYPRLFLNGREKNKSPFRAEGLFANFWPQKVGEISCIDTAINDRHAPDSPRFNHSPMAQYFR